MAEQFDTVRVVADVEKGYIVQASRRSLKSGLEASDAWVVESVSIDGDVGMGITDKVTFEREPHGITVTINEYENGEYKEAELSFKQ